MGAINLNLGSAGPEEIVSFALAAMRDSEDGGLAQLDAISSPVYATDAEGHVTWFNQACIRFSGRTPVAGTDRWCVTWKLYTADGESLPHSECPMAVAIKQVRPVRGVKAIAERPDGSHVRFTPYPTPVCDANGKLLGAVNILIDLAQGGSSDRLREQAKRCRRLARGIDDTATKDTLLRLAQDYDDRANTQGHLN
jgi:PAS domain-containing protein